MILCILSLTLLHFFLICWPKHSHWWMLLHGEISKGKLYIRGHVLFTGACPDMQFNKAHYYFTLSKVCVSSSVVSHSGQGILSWRWCSSGKMTDWRDMQWGLWFRTASTFPVMSVALVVKLWRKLWGGPMVLLSLCHPELSPHPYTSRCTWQLGPAGTCAPMACRKSAPRRTEAWQPPLFILWLTWVVFLNVFVIIKTNIKTW